MSGYGLKKIVLEDEWLGHQKGTVLEIVEGMALQLIARGTAKEASDKKLAPRSDKVLKEAITK